MLSKITGNKFICMEFVFVIYICKFIIFFKQVLLKYFSLLKRLFFLLLKL